MLMLLVCPDQDIHPYVSSLSAAEMSNRIHPLVRRERCDDVFREVIIPPTSRDGTAIIFEPVILIFKRK